MATFNAFTAEAIAIVALMTLKPDCIPVIVLVIAAALIGIALAFIPSRRRNKGRGGRGAGRMARVGEDGAAATRG